MERSEEFSYTTAQEHEKHFYNSWYRFRSPTPFQHFYTDLFCIHYLLLSTIMNVISTNILRKYFSNFFIWVLNFLITQLSIRFEIKCKEKNCFRFVTNLFLQKDGCCAYSCETVKWEIRKYNVTKFCKFIVYS